MKRCKNACLERKYIYQTRARMRLDLTGVKQEMEEMEREVV